MTRAILPTRVSNMPLDPPAEAAAGQRRRSLRSHRLSARIVNRSPQSFLSG
jgi:hypothetical protein